MDKMQTKPASQYDPNFRDWALLAINLAFVAMGLFLLRSEPRTGIVTLAFFGTCGAVAAGQVWRKLYDRRFEASLVEVQGGVPLRRSRMLNVLIGGWLLVLGIVLAMFGDGYPALFRWLSAFIALGGAGFVLAALSGYFPRGYLQFDPEGLTISSSTYRALLPWHAINVVQEAEHHGNAILLIDVADLAGITIVPEAARAKALAQIAQSEAWLGAPFTIMPIHYGLSLPMLAHAVRRYAADPDARAKLGRRGIVP